MEFLVSLNMANVVELDKAIHKLKNNLQKEC